MFLIAMATVAMASCSKDETTGTNTGRGIDFRASIGNSTRAVETTTANLSSFYVTALNGTNTLFSNLEFTKNGGFFTSAENQYWPADGSQVQFFAYAPATKDLGGTLRITSSVKQLSNFKPSTVIADQKDFIFASATGDKENNETSGVDLTFEHALSQIGIQAKSDNADYTIEVVGVKIAKVSGTGTFNFANSNWNVTTTTAAKVAYSVEYEDSPLSVSSRVQSLMGAGGNAMLIPQSVDAWDNEGDATNDLNGGYISVKVHVENASGNVVYPRNGEYYGWVAMPVDIVWEMGNKYVYTLDFTNGFGFVDPDEYPNPGGSVLGAPIKFTVTVSAWTDAGQDIAM